MKRGKKSLFVFMLLAPVLFYAGCKDKEHHALISTEFGDIEVMLYNSTPQHKDNFIKLAKSGFYDSLLFHRVIANFMIQGGDPVSKNAPDGTTLGAGGPGYEIPAEIGAPHLRGALAAARLPSNDKRSSGSQFYIVTGVKQNESELQYYQDIKKIKYNEAQRNVYMNQGGYPGLDMEYTVFGEVVSGMEVVDKISQEPKDPGDRPLKNIRMKIKMID
ncbi:MAG TPA: peptidylprolyl isomerase [Saprospiraceae bacterium]|nr:peptidylprolyl isomerase [Saprospiraceae bacterium]